MIVPIGCSAPGSELRVVPVPKDILLNSSCELVRPGLREPDERAGLVHDDPAAFDGMQAAQGETARLTVAASKTLG